MRYVKSIKVIIRYMETDKIMVFTPSETEPTMSISKYGLTRQLEYKAKWNAGNTSK